MTSHEYWNDQGVRICVISPISWVLYMWKLNPSDRTITLTKLLIKHANLPTKETEIGA